MNLLRSLWNWFLELIGKAPAPALEVVEKQDDCCESDDCVEPDTCISEAPPLVEEAPPPVEEPPPAPLEAIVEEEVEEVLEEIEEDVAEEITEDVVVEESSDLSAGELLREILLSEKISTVVLEKYKVIDTFEAWYDGPCEPAAVRASIESFKEEHGGSIRSKLSRVK